MLQICFLSPMGKNEYTLKYILQKLDQKIRIVNNYDQTITILWNWQDRTSKKIWQNLSDWNWLSYLQPLPHPINSQYQSISKKRVMKCFQQAFGYKLEIDPLKYRKQFIVKSNRNARHDGKIRDKPLGWKNPKKGKEKYFKLLSQGKVFQKYIDTTDPKDDNFNIHYRVPFFRKLDWKELWTIGWTKNTALDLDLDWSEIPLVYEARVKKKNHFNPVNEVTYLRKPDQIFSQTEMNKLHRLLNIMKIDYAELDVLRDRKNGQIYVIDVNDTPTITINGYDQSKFNQGIERQAKVFEKWLKQFLPPIEIKDNSLEDFIDEFK